MHTRCTQSTHTFNIPRKIFCMRVWGDPRVFHFTFTSCLPCMAGLALVFRDYENLTSLNLTLRVAIVKFSGWGAHTCLPCYPVATVAHQGNKWDFTPVQFIRVCQIRMYVCVCMIVCTIVYDVWRCVRVLRSLFTKLYYSRDIFNNNSIGE